MSTGLNLLYFETAKGEWYYCLESGRGSKGAWDWTEDADVIGPFPTPYKANEHMSANNANTGSYFQAAYAEQGEREHIKYAGLAARALKPTTRPYVMFW